MKLVSEEILPKEKRATCTTEEALSCLEELEKSIKDKYQEDLDFDTYDAMSSQIKTLNQDIKDNPLRISSEEKDFDRVLKYAVDLGKIIDGLKSIKGRIEKSDLFIQKKVIDVKGVEI